MKLDYNDYSAQANLRGWGWRSLRQKTLLPCLLVGHHIFKGTRSTWLETIYLSHQFHTIFFTQFLSIIILSVRTDRLSDSAYLASHWKHYGGMLVFALVAWLPQVSCLVSCLDGKLIDNNLSGWFSFELTGVWKPGSCVFFNRHLHSLCCLHIW